MRRIVVGVDESAAPQASCAGQYVRPKCVAGRYCGARRVSSTSTPPPLGVPIDLIYGKATPLPCESLVTAAVGMAAAAAIEQWS